MSIKELNSLAREKKKQADSEKRTFEDVKQSMSLYLESVCYFIQCARDEPVSEQRRTLLTATVAMLQFVIMNKTKKKILYFLFVFSFLSVYSFRHLVSQYEKVFQISTNRCVDSLNNIRPKFLLIK